MTKDLGAWAVDDCALVLTDYQMEIVRGHRLGGAGWWVARTQAEELAASRVTRTILDTKEVLL